MTRKLAILALLLFTFTSKVQAQYFKFIDPQHPVVYIGALVDPKNIHNVLEVQQVALITHSPSDGSLLPAPFQETWTPLAIGPTVGNRNLLAFGPVANISPQFEKFILDSLNYATNNDPTKYPNLKGLLQLSQSKGPDLTFAYGIQWLTDISADAHLSPNKWRFPIYVYWGPKLTW